MGGREERRMVYAHLQACAIRAFDSSRELALKGGWANARNLWSGKRKAREGAVAAARELLEAASELVLVGNAGPVTAGMDLFVAASSVNTDHSPDHKANEGVDGAFYEALDKFIEVCKEDLWYLPQWWQIWRPAWWGVRWESRKERRNAKRGRRAEAETSVA